jgi:hypothetical protein
MTGELPQAVLLSRGGIGYSEARGKERGQYLTIEFGSDVQEFIAKPGFLDDRPLTWLAII